MEVPPYNGDSVKFYGVLNAKKHWQMLYLSIMKTHQGGDFKFIQQQDDNHKVIKNYLQREEQEVREVMSLPSQSPDLNIMECVWDLTKRQKDVKELTSAECLCFFFSKMFLKNLPDKFLHQLCAKEEMMLFEGGPNIDLDFSFLFIHFTDLCK